MAGFVAATNGAVDEVAPPAEETSAVSDDDVVKEEDS